MVLQYYEMDAHNYIDYVFEFSSFIYLFFLNKISSEFIITVKC